jgi:hypothetical protein
MTLHLPDPPESLKPAPRLFYDELRRMLEGVQAAQVDPRRSSAKFDNNGVEVVFVHLNRKDWTVWATVGDREAIVATLGAHEHFFAPSDGAHEERPWTTEIVDFVAEILRGQIEVETTYRGRAPISVRHFNLDTSGKRHQLGHTGFLTPARLFLWQSKRTETETGSWL